MLEASTAPVRQVERLPGGARVRRVAWPEPSLRGDWVIVEPQLTGLCSSDLKEVRGTREARSDFGHELVGLVHSSSVPELFPGTRVCLDPHPAVTRWTAFGTAMLIAGGRDELRAALPTAPPNAPDERAVFAEPLACVAHCARRMEAPKRVAIVGAGTAGVLLSVLLRLRGCAVTLVNRSESRLAALAGMDTVAGTGLIVAEDAEAGGSDAVVLTTSLLDERTFRLAWRLLPETGGQLVLYGGIAAAWRAPECHLPLDEVRRRDRDAELAWGGKRARLVGVHGPTPDDFTTAVRVLDAPLPWSSSHVEELIARRLDLPGLVQVLTAAARGGADPPGKCVVDVRK